MATSGPVTLARIKPQQTPRGSSVRGVAMILIRVFNHEPPEPGEYKVPLYLLTTFHPYYYSYTERRGTSRIHVSSCYFFTL